MTGTTCWRRFWRLSFGVVAIVAGCGGDGQQQTGGLPDGDGGAGGASGADAGSGTSSRPIPSVQIFDDNQLHEVRLDMDPADWQSIIADSHADDWRHATLTYDGVIVPEVGVRPSGEASRFPGNPKMSVRIKFNAFSGTATFGGLAAISVKGEYEDTSMLRERLALFVFRAAMPAPRAVHGRLIVNGALRGLYTIREVWDARSIREHFSEPIGPLYRLRPPAGDVDPYADLGPDSQSYVPVPWEPHIPDTVPGDEVIGPFLAGLAGGDAAVEHVTDVENLLAYLACSAVVMNTDGLAGNTGVEDHFQYYDPSSRKFFILPWDPDNTFSSQGETPDRTIDAHLGRSRLGAVVRDNDDIHARYVAKIAATMASIPPERIAAEIERIYAQIQQAAYEDPNKLQPNDAFDWAAGYIKDFVSLRYADLMAQIR